MTRRWLPRSRITPWARPIGLLPRRSSPPARCARTSRPMSSRSETRPGHCLLRSGHGNSCCPKQTRPDCDPPAGVACSRPSGRRATAFSQPLALGLTTLGLAGLLITDVPSVFQGAGGSAASAPSATSGDARRVAHGFGRIDRPCRQRGTRRCAERAGAGDPGRPRRLRPDIAGEPTRRSPNRITAQGSAGPGASPARPVAGAASSGDPVPSPADGQDLSDGAVLKQVAPEDAATSKVVDRRGHVPHRRALACSRSAGLRAASGTADATAATAARGYTWPPFRTVTHYPEACRWNA